MRKEIRIRILLGYHDSIRHAQAQGLARRISKAPQSGEAQLAKLEAQALALESKIETAEAEQPSLEPSILHCLHELSSFSTSSEPSFQATHSRLITLSKSSEIHPPT